MNKGYSPAVPSERSFGKASLLLLSFRETIESDATVAIYRTTGNPGSLCALYCIIST